MRHVAVVPRLIYRPGVIGRAGEAEPDAGVTSGRHGTAWEGRVPSRSVTSRARTGPARDWAARRRGDSDRLYAASSLSLSLSRFQSTTISQASTITPRRRLYYPVTDTIVSS